MESDKFVDFCDFLASQCLHGEPFLIRFERACLIDSLFNGLLNIICVRTPLQLVDVTTKLLKILRYIDHAYLASVSTSTVRTTARLTALRRLLYVDIYLLLELAFLGIELGDFSPHILL